MENFPSLNLETAVNPKPQYGKRAFPDFRRRCTTKLREAIEKNCGASLGNDSISCTEFSNGTRTAAWSRFRHAEINVLIPSIPCAPGACAVNRQHEPKLERIHHVRQQILVDPCFALYVGAKLFVKRGAHERKSLETRDRQLHFAILNDAAQLGWSAFPARLIKTINDPQKFFAFEDFGLSREALGKRNICIPSVKKVVVCPTRRDAGESRAGLRIFLFRRIDQVALGEGDQAFRFPNLFHKAATRLGRFVIRLACAEENSPETLLQSFYIRQNPGRHLRVTLIAILSRPKELKAQLVQASPRHDRS